MRIPQFDDDYLYHGADSVNDDDLSHVLDQAENITRKVDNMLSFGAQVILLLEMVRDYVTGKYKSIPYRTIAAFVFSLLYVLNPVDLIPDVLPGIGILDDIMLIALVLSWARADIQQYRAWREKNDAENGDGTPVAAPKNTHNNR
nr:hypothetical protein 24 [Candidatus Hydrogenedentota bacterium]